MNATAVISATTRQPALATLRIVGSSAPGGLAGHAPLPMRHGSTGLMLAASRQSTTSPSASREPRLPWTVRTPESAAPAAMAGIAGAALGPWHGPARASARAGPARPAQSRRRVGRRGTGSGTGPGRPEVPPSLRPRRSRGGRVWSPASLTNRTNPMAATMPTAFQYVRGWSRRPAADTSWVRVNTPGKTRSDKPLADDDQCSERERRLGGSRGYRAASTPRCRREPHRGTGPPAGHRPGPGLATGPSVIEMIVHTAEPQRALRRPARLRGCAATGACRRRPPTPRRPRP